MLPINMDLHLDSTSRNPETTGSLLAATSYKDSQPTEVDSCLRDVLHKPFALVALQPDSIQNAVALVFSFDKHRKTIILRDDLDTSISISGS